MSDGEDDSKKLRSQIEFYLSARNLKHDAFLVGQFDSQFLVPVPVFLQFARVRQLLGDREDAAAAIVESLKGSDSVLIVEGADGADTRLGSKQLRPAQRLTIVLRDVPAAVTEDDVKALFAPLQPASLTPDIAQTWFVQFATEADCRDALMSLAGKQLGGEPARGRIKSEVNSLQGLIARLAGPPPTASAPPPHTHGRGGGKGRGGYPLSRGGGYPTSRGGGMPATSAAWWPGPVPMQMYGGYGGKGKGRGGRQPKQTAAEAADPTHPTAFPALPSAAEDSHRIRWSASEILSKITAFRESGALSGAVERLLWPIPAAADCACVVSDPILKCALEEEDGAALVSAADVVHRAPDPRTKKTRVKKATSPFTSPSAAPAAEPGFEPPPTEGGQWAAMAGLGPQAAVATD